MSDKMKAFVRETIDEILESLPTEERLKGLPPDEVAKILSPEERLRGLSADEVDKALSPETREALARKYKVNGTAKPE